ncbi:MAG: hypothetical protein M1158_01900 [Candidatus Marsarchaeota archaeon]|nr:hypothetical protein [Candidatus Marsarchaeota archaeon]
MPKRRNELLGGRAVRTLAYALYAVLAALFIIEFVELDSAPFILYSFLPFVALGILLGMYGRHTGPVIMMAIVFIAVSSIFYSMDALMLQFVWINLAIVGYYLLISAVLGIFIAMAAESNGLSRHLKAAARNISKFMSGRAAGYAAIIIAVALLVAPIWPSSLTVQLTDYTNATRAVQYYGTAINASSFTVIADPWPYNYTIPLCANGTNATAVVSVRRTNGMAYAFLFGNESSMQGAFAATAGWPVPRQPGIYRAHAKYTIETDNSTAAASIAIPSHSCAYMVLFFENLSTIRVTYNINYFGLLQKYVTVRVPVPGATMVINKTSDVVSSMRYLSSNYKN